MDDDMLTDPTTTTAAGASDNHHPNTIVHIDIDCFYAQVEELHDPTLRDRPLGIQQKNIIVTCNYVARDRGVGKLQLLTEAVRVCPDLVLVRGEDLTRYRKMSARIFEVLHGFTAHVEKLGMDENYMDVTALVAERLAAAAAASDNGTTDVPAHGHVYPPDDAERFAAIGTDGGCRCGCARRLRMGSVLAGEIRARLHAELGITSCAGIAHNKLLAKWVGSRNKPNKQTVFVPLAAARTWRTLSALREICGIGERTEVLLRELHVETVAQLQDVPVERLRRQFGGELAAKLKEWSYGRDGGAVKASGAPKSIGLEDSCRSISVRVDVEEKFRLLLIRLIEQVIEDGRVPIVIKITVRKFDAARRSSHRETKQANVVPSLFRQLGDGKILLAEGAQEKLLRIVMRLFERAVDLRRSFNITLLGLAFSKFQERRKGSRNIASFLIKKSDVEVQSITSLSSEGYGSPNTTAASGVSGGSVGSVDGATTPRYVTSSPMHMDFECISDTSHASCSSDVSESEVEPSPKKSRLGGLLMSRRRCFQASSAAGGVSSADGSFDASSPSKLRVGDLRLSSEQHTQPHTLQAAAAKFGGNSAPQSPLSATTTSLSPNTPSSRAGALHSLFYPSPLASVSHDVSLFSASASRRSPLAASPPCTPRTPQTPPPATMPNTATSPLGVSVGRLPAECPPSVDAAVFGELPADVQGELLAQWRNASKVAAAASTTTTTSTSTIVAAAGTSAGPSGKAKANTLHRYFIAHSQ